MNITELTNEYLSPFKSRDKISVTCCGCKTDVLRTVKSLRHSIKMKKKFLFCNNKCQGLMLKINKIKQCKYCKNNFYYNFKTQKYCSIKCGNYDRTLSNDTKLKISNSLCEYNNKISNPQSNHNRKKFNKLWKDNDYSKIYNCKCIVCGFNGVYRILKRYCNNCQERYSGNGRSKYNFSFNVYKYPDLFDLTLLKKHGWMNTKGKNKNTSGVSRDHKVSVNESLKYDYDPYYIKHPLNCELMLHRDNKSKGTDSSITYAELVKL